MRRVTLDDESLFNSWLSLDVVHKMNGITFADLLAEGTEAWLISDELGPLMFMRGHLAFRVAMQFSPSNPLRTARVGKEVVGKMKEMAKEKGCLEVVIRPGGAAVNFSERLGFSEFNGKYITVKERL